MRNMWIQRDDRGLPVARSKATLIAAIMEREQDGLCGYATNSDSAVRLLEGREAELEGASFAQLKAVFARRGAK